MNTNIGNNIGNNPARWSNRSAAEKQNFVEDYVRSGQSMSAYCKEHNLSLSSFGTWKAKIVAKERDAAAKTVIDRSYMAVSFLVDMILDKVLYSQPLYRQHQSMTREGFHLSRGVLTTNFIKPCEVMGRLIEPLRYSILAGSRIAIDETPMKVGVNEVKVS